jgi:hypothetical protein
VRFIFERICTRSLFETIWIWMRVKSLENEKKSKKKWFILNDCNVNRLTDVSIREWTSYPIRIDVSILYFLIYFRFYVYFEYLFAKKINMKFPQSIPAIANCGLSEYYKWAIEDLTISQTNQKKSKQIE